MKDDRYEDIEKNPGNKKKLLCLGVVDVEPEIHYRWRLAVNIVAYVNLVIGAASYAVLGICTACFIYVSVQMKRGCLDQEIQELIPRMNPETENLYIYLGVATLFLVTCLTSLEFISANVLRKATTKITDPYKILEKCVFWRNASIIMLLISTLSIVIGFNPWMVWLWLTFRVFSLIMIWLHMREVKEASYKPLLQKHKHVLNAKENVRKKLIMDNGLSI